jgi:RNA polymerase sigma-70 factor (ECF subfamily)
MIFYLSIIETPEEKSKLERIYLEYRGIMFHAANSILHNEQDAEDAVHQAFIKVAENIQKIENPVCSKTKGYVVTIVENKAIDQYRRRSKHPTVDLDEELQGIPAVYNGENILTACILKLPARYREMILLRYHYGYSVKEIAAILEISFSAASKLNQRAKKKLEDLYKKEEQS